MTHLQRRPVGLNQFGCRVALSNEQIFLQAGLVTKPPRNLEDRVLLSACWPKGFETWHEVFKNHERLIQLMARGVVQLEPSSAPGCAFGAIACDEDLQTGIRQERGR